MRVLAEDPKTGKVEAEPVVRLITDRVSPLLAVELSDGTVLKVTADHPFWVDSGAHLAHSGWLHAEHLRPGDLLRTAKGTDVVVVRVRRNVGHAVVYTLTVAHDHTFFVGSARVLVHNCDVTLDPRKFSDYVLDPARANGKDKVFIDEIGYSNTPENVDELVQLYRSEGAARFSKGEYTLGKLDQYGQRYTIEVDVPGKGASAGKTYRLLSGWIVGEDGALKLATPFSGFAD